MRDGPTPPHTSQERESSDPAHAHCFYEKKTVVSEQPLCVLPRLRFSHVGLLDLFLNGTTDRLSHSQLDLGLCRHLQEDFNLSHSQATPCSSSLWSVPLHEDFLKLEM